MSQQSRPILEVEDLSTVFRTRDGDVHAVNGISFSLERGEILGIVGESGSGKSVAMMSLVNLLPTPPAEILSGRVTFDGVDLREVTPDAMRRIRGREIGFVFQDPMTSLNPVFSVGFQLMEPLRRQLGMNGRAARGRARELLELVGIPDGARRLGDFPHQFSGGMRQRVMIAMALACEPKLLIADEPTTALDVTIQAQILELIQRLREMLGMAIIWITHDLGVVAGLAHRVAVMYGGQIVEHGEVRRLFRDPRHPYTRLLLETLPRMDGQRAERLRSIVGQPPSLGAVPAACTFAPRCPHAFARCARENPFRRDVEPRHDVACWWDAAAEGFAPARAEGA